MRHVLDTSMTLSFVLADEFDAEAERMVAQIARDGAIVPSLWDFEVIDALRSAERRGRLNEVGISTALQGLHALAVERDRRSVDGQRLLSVSREFGLSAYDAAYLVLAIDENMPLATRDVSLLRAAEQAGVKTNV